MINIRTILCPLDLSDTSGTAFDYAAMLARWYGASLTVLEMVWPGVPPIGPATSAMPITPEQMQEFSAELQAFVDAKKPAGVTVDVKLREGAVVRGILQEARAISADLIIMGTHGRGGFDRFILGSVTEKVLRKSPYPVLTVPPKTEGVGTSAQPFQTIVCPIDFSVASERALHFALSLAQESGKRLRLLHVLEWPVDRTPTPGFGPDTSEIRRRHEESALRELHALVPDDARIWCDCTEQIAIGRPYEEILRVSSEERADLIVMGVHGRSGVELALFGSTTNHIVRGATCPVLTIRP